MVQTTESPTGRAVERKRQILEGAARVFRRDGLHAAGMREIPAALDTPEFQAMRGWYQFVPHIRARSQVFLAR